MPCAHEQVAVDAAVGVAQPRELRVGGEEALQALVADTPGATVSAAASSTRSRTMRVERLAARLGRVEQLHIDVRHLLAHALDLLRWCAASHSACVMSRPSTLATVVAPPVVEAAVALDAEEHERREDQQHQEPCNRRVC